MHPELSVALNFLVSHLYNKLPRRRVDVFAEELEKALKTKFQDHWYPEEPFKGSGYRSIRIVEGKLDPAFRIASQLSGLTLEEILEHLPKGLTIWIDPDEVSYRIGETGQVTILYFNKRTPAGSVPSCLDPLSVTPNNFGSYPADNMSNMEQLNYLFNCFGTRAMESSREQDLSFSFEKMKLDGNSPIGGRPTYSHPFQNALQANSNNQLLLGLNKNKNSNCFTAAAFAQTKFGSTKMKNHSSHQARPTRLTATSSELQNRLNMAAQMNALNARSPGSFMPYMGFHPHPPNGGWPLERQTSAPSSCLNSPSSGFMPMSNGHLFSHLVQPSPGMSRQSPNESLPTPVSSSTTHSPSGLSLIEQAVLKQDLQFSGLPKGIQHQISPHSPDKLNPSPILPSPSTESPSSEKSLSNDVDWNSFVSNYPNLHHLLVAN